METLRRCRRSHVILLMILLALIAGQGADGQPQAGAAVQQSLMECFYDAEGTFKGADSAGLGEQENDIVRGDGTWYYVVAGDDGNSCSSQPPAELSNLIGLYGAGSPARWRGGLIVSQ